MVRESLAFFGAFNPPTAAHLSLAAFAARATGAKRVIFVPSKSSYIRKEQGKDFAYSGDERLKMLRLAAETRPWMEISDTELLSPEQPRTYDTLCRLRDAGREASLLLGSDKLPELEHGWLHVEEIAREYGIVVLTRGGDDCEAIIRESAFLSALRPHLTVLDTPPETRSVSSSAVRARVARIMELEAELGTMVPKEILPLLRDGRGDPKQKEEGK